MDERQRVSNAKHDEMTLSALNLTKVIHQFFLNVLNVKPLRNAKMCGVFFADIPW